MTKLRRVKIESKKMKKCNDENVKSNSCKCAKVSKMCQGLKNVENVACCEKWFKVSKMS